MVGRGLLLAGLALPGEGKMVRLLKSLHLHAFSMIRFIQRRMFFNGLVLINLVPEQPMHSPSSLMERDGAENKDSQLVFERLSSLTGLLGT